MLTPSTCSVPNRGSGFDADQALGLGISLLMSDTDSVSKVAIAGASTRGASVVRYVVVHCRIFATVRAVKNPAHIWFRCSSVRAAIAGGMTSPTGSPVANMSTASRHPRKTA